jgi:hypothetical protein
MRAAGESCLRMHAARVLSDDTCPELTTDAVSLRHTDDPTNGKSIPENKRGPSTYAAATVPTNDKELGDIEVIGIIGGRRATRNQCEADDPRTEAHEKGEPPLRFRPVEGKFLVSEASIGSQLQVESITEIVRVQL